MGENRFAGEKRLARAVFKQAMADLTGVIGRNGRIGSERLGLQSREFLLAEVTDWFLNPDPAPYSFELVASALALDAEGMRRNVNHYLCREPSSAPPARLLRESDVIAIRASKEATAALARRFGVADSTVRKIRSGKRWRIKQRESLNGAKK